MFFIFGVDNGRRDIPYGKVMICDICGKYGRYEVFMTYLCFSLFFIPVFKWKKTYYVKSTCCQALYTLDPVIGRLLAKGEEIEIYKDQLTRVDFEDQWNHKYHQWNANSNTNSKKICSYCKFESPAEYLYCPKCGSKL